MKGHVTRASLRPGSVATILMRAARADGAHALVWSLFEGEERGERTFLYREEAPGCYLIVSTVPPADEAGVWSLETKPYEPSLTTGDRLAFALRVNPAVTVRDGERTRRTDAVMKAKHGLDRAGRRAVDEEAVLSDWLSVRLAARGATLNTAALLAFDVNDRARAGDGRYTRSVADMEGTLTVEDPAAFTSSLFAGYGKARAYGCGLLLVRRI